MVLGYAVKIGDTPFDQFLMALDNANLSLFNFINLADETLPMNREVIPIIRGWLSPIEGFEFPIKTHRGYQVMVQLINGSSQSESFKKKIIEIVLKEQTDLNAMLGSIGHWTVKFHRGTSINACIVDIASGGYCYYVGVKRGVTHASMDRGAMSTRPKSMGRPIRSTTWQWYYNDIVTFLLKNVSSISKDGVVLYTPPTNADLIRRSSTQPSSASSSASRYERMAAKHGYQESQSQ